MRTNTDRFRHVRIMATLFLATVAACPDGNSGDPEHYGCGLTKVDYDFPVSSGSVNVQKPARCEFRLTEAISVPFGATITVASSAVYGGYYDKWVKNRQGQVTSFSGNPMWDTIEGGNTYVIQLTGTYYAGSGGFNSNSAGYDDWYHEFQKPEDGYVVAYSRLPYSSIPSYVPTEGPGHGVASGATFQVVGNVKDPIMVGDVTWDFYLDNTLVVSGSSTPYYNFTAGSPDTEHQIDVRATDANGRSQWGYTFVTVCSSGVFIC